jgi:hypothetical protein
MKRVKRQLATGGYICSILFILFGTPFMAQVVAAAVPDLRWLDLEFFKVGVGVTDDGFSSARWPGDGGSPVDLVKPYHVLETPADQHIGLRYGSQGDVKHIDP